MFIPDCSNRKSCCLLRLEEELMRLWVWQCLLVPTFIILQPPTSLAARFATEASFNAQNNAAGGVIMPKMTNATAKAELGRAGWKVRSRLDK